MNIHSVLTSSSIYTVNEGSHFDGISREVPVATIDDLCRKKGLYGPCLIIIDVQGAELDILAGATNIRQNT